MRTQDFYKDTYIIRNVDFLYVNKHNIETHLLCCCIFMFALCWVAIKRSDFIIKEL